MSLRERSDRVHRDEAWREIGWVKEERGQREPILGQGQGLHQTRDDDEVGLS